jgi:hypothetical protein
VTQHPRAYCIQVMSCGGPECEHPHLVLFDRDGNIIADAVIARDDIDWLAERLHEAADRIAGGEAAE